jgi:hypothetical protein
MKNKLVNLNKRFETVTLQLEKLEIKRDELILLDKDTSSLEDKIYNLEDIQYQIQCKIEDLENLCDGTGIKLCS